MVIANKKRKSRSAPVHERGITLIETMRIEKGWDREELAGKAGFKDKKTIDRALQGIPIDENSIEKIARALGIDFNDLIDLPAKKVSTHSKSSLDRNLMGWQKICGEMLGKQKEARQLRKEATAIGAEVNVYVPLDLLEHKEQTRSKQDKGDSDQRNQHQEPKVVKTYEHKDFLDSLTDRQSKNKHIAIVGEAGAGKTTLLARIADELDKNQKLQIFVSLADLRERSLEEYIYGNWLSKALGVHKDYINEEQKSDLFQQFQSGEIWLLLDGLDEMRAKSSADALEKINREIKEVIGQSRVVLTSRLNVWDAYLNRLSGFDTFRMGDFSPEQVDKFICDWFVSAEKPESAPILQAKLKEPNRDRIRDMVRHPLRLALLCQAFYRDLNTELPETKAGLYELFVRYFYEWKPNIVDEDLTQDTLREELHLALGKLAIAGIDGDAGFQLSRSLAVKEMGDRLFRLASDVGWLTLIERDEQDQEVYAFYHASFQEYFAALAIDDWDFFVPRNHINKPVKDDLGNYRKYRIFEAIWKEVITLWLGRNNIVDSNKIDFINFITKFEDNCENFYCFKAYELAALLTVETINIKLLDALINEITDQVVLWAFGNYNQENLEWSSYSETFAKKSRSILSQMYIPRVVRTLLTTLDDFRHQFKDYYDISLESDSYNEIIFKVLEISDKLGEFAANTILISEIAIDRIEKEEYPYDHIIFYNCFGKKIDKPIIIKKLLSLLSEKRNGKFTRNSDFLNSTNLNIFDCLIFVLGKSINCKEEIISELVKIMNNPNYEIFHWLVATSLCKIDPNNHLGITELLKVIDEPSPSVSSYELPFILEETAKNNTLAIDLLSQIVISRDLNSYSNHLAIICLVNIANGDYKTTHLFIDVLEKAKKYETSISYQNSKEQLDNSFVSTTIHNICSYIVDIYKDKLIDIKLLDKIISTLTSFLEDPFFESIYIYIIDCIGVIDSNNPLVLNKIIEVIEKTGYDFAMDYIDYEFTNSNKLIPLLSTLVVSSETEEQKNGFSRILAKIDIGNQLAIMQLASSVRNPKSRSFLHSNITSLVETLKNTEQMKTIVSYLNNSLSSNNDNEFELTNNYFDVHWHCAQNMSYPDFYEAWHSQPTSTHPEVTDTIPSSNTNKIQTLESQLIDCEAIQKELDLNTDHPEIRCLVVDIRHLEQESDPNIIAKKLTNKIFNSIGRRIPVVQDVSCLERELLNLKLEPDFEKLAIAIYGKNANEAIAQLCQSLAPIQTRLFTGEQTSEQLTNEVKAWLRRINLEYD